MGAGGFVGSAISNKLLSEGIETLPLGRNDVDLLQSDAVEKLLDLIKPGDSFVAVSAIAPVKNSKMLVDNLRLAQTITSALSKRNDDIVHVINIGSDAVYSDISTPLLESSHTAPTNYHGIMHVAREVMFVNEINAPLVTLRPTLIYGAGDTHNGYGPNQFCRLANAGKEIVLFGEGEELRDHVLIDDVAEIACLALLHRSHGIINVATGRVTSFLEIANRVSNLTNPSVAVQTSPRTGPMPHNGYRAFNNSVTSKCFPSFQYTLIEDGLQKCFDTIAPI